MPLNSFCSYGGRGGRRRRCVCSHGFWSCRRRSNTAGGPATAVAEAERPSDRVGRLLAWALRDWAIERACHRKPGEGEGGTGG